MVAMLTVTVTLAPAFVTPAVFLAGAAGVTEVDSRAEPSPAEHRAAHFDVADGERVDAERVIG